MRSGCLAHAATRNCDRFEAAVDASVVSKMSAEEPKTSCIVEMDHMCVGEVLNRDEHLESRRREEGLG
jgi:hypothetical protein